MSQGSMDAFPPAALMITGRQLESRRRLRILAPLGLAALALLGWLALVAPSADAQAGERIRSYDVAIAIEADGALLINETIAYDFGTNQRHGILRDIPVRLHYDDRYDRVYPLDVIDVSASEGTPDQYKLEEPGGGMLRIRVGDPDRTVTGLHSYHLRYRVEGALNGFADHVELYWNAVGLAWDVPIDAASVEVTAPADVQRVACFEGAARSSLACDVAEAAGQVAHFSQASLGPHAGITVVVSIPPGSVPAPEPILTERWSLRRAFTVSPWTVGASLGLLGAVGLVVGRLLWIAGRDRRWAGSAVDVVFGPPGGEGTVEAVGLFDGGPYPVEFTPPDDLRPGQIGVLIDEIAHPLDVTATIIDLGVRGYLRLEEVPPTGLFAGWFGKPDWRLVRLREADGLLEYERLLLDGLFEDGDEVLLSSLRTKFVSRLSNVQDALYREAVARRWFVRSPVTTRNLWLAIGAVVLLMGGLIEAGAIAWTHLALIPLALPLAGLVILAAHRAMPRRTPRGTATLARVRGFRRFIETAETDRARFAEQANLFFEYLPYAIVFGATERWARAFEGLAEAPSNAGWYVSTRPFAATAFADSMDSFAVTSTGAIASTPGGSGSSGFGGGVGGGGGGGGGGSW